MENAGKGENWPGLPHGTGEKSVRKRSGLGICLVSIVLILIAESTAVCSGAGIVPPFFNKIRIEHLTAREGLFYLDVRDVAQNRQGFMWIATLDGLEPGQEIDRRTAALPAQLREKLHHAATRAHMRATHLVIEEIRGVDDIVAAALQRLADKFDYGRISAIAGGDGEMDREYQHARTNRSEKQTF